MADYRPAVIAAARKHGVPEDLALKVYDQETRGQPDRARAISPAGAIGPMQLMPGTARDLGVNPHVPEQNIDGGVRYLKRQLDDFGDASLALAAYNAGPGAVRKHGGVPPYAETQNYVRDIMGGAGSDDIFGFADAAPTRPRAGSPAPAGSDDIFGFSAPSQPPGPAAQADEMTMPSGSSAPTADALDQMFELDHWMLRAPGVDMTPDKAQRQLTSELWASDRGEKGSNTLVQLDPETGLYSQPGLTNSISFDPETGEPVIELRGSSNQDHLKELYERQAGVRASQQDFLHAGRIQDRSLETLDGLLLGFGDELLGAEAFVSTALGNAVKSATGETPEYSAAEAYRGAQAGADLQRREYEREHGREALAIQLASGLAPGLGPMKWVGRGETLLGRTGRSAVAGAGYGATSGFGHGDDLGDRLAGAGGGAVLGAGVGAAIPGAVETVGSAIKGGRYLLTPEATRFALRETDAENRVAAVVDRAIGRDLQDSTHLATTLRANPDIPTFQQGGDNLASVAEVLAQSPGPGARIVRESVRDFQGREADQIKADIAKALSGTGDYFATVEAKLANRKQVAEPFKDAAFSDQMDPGGYDRLIAPVLPRVPKSAIKYAYDIARVEGRNPDELGITAMMSDEPAKFGDPARADPFFERAFDMLRKSRTGKNTQGESLIEYIARRGGLNEPGELSRMDAQLWHRAKPFLPKLIKETGDSADGMAMRLWEAGYFPNLRERPTPRDLFDAIRKELAGQKIYAKAADEPNADLNRYTDGLERRLAEAGIDPATTKPREAWKRLFDYEAETRSLDDLLEEGTASRPPRVDLGYEQRPTLETLHFVKKGWTWNCANCVIPSPASSISRTIRWRRRRRRFGQTSARRCARSAPTTTTSCRPGVTRANTSTPFGSVMPC